MAGMGIPAGSQGFLYEPDNEQETVALFVRVMHMLKPSWCIKRLQGSFPDGLFYDAERGVDVRAEFEYLASHFFDHKHDPKGCDLIICWENDLAPSALRTLGMGVLALKQELATVGNGSVCLGWKRETSLDARVQTDAASGERGAIAVGQFVQDALPALQTRHPGLRLDRGLSRHYMLKWNGQALVGLYPDGKLVVMSLRQYHRQFGEAISQAAESFHRTLREQVRGLNGSPKLSDDDLQARLRLLRDAVDAFCGDLETLDGLVARPGSTG